MIDHDILDLYQREALIRTDHDCACPTCDPSLEVSSVRQGQNHVIVRFWDSPSLERARNEGGVIELDGVPVIHAFEAILGDEGTVWSWCDTPIGMHRCLRCIALNLGSISEDHVVRINRSPEGTTTHTAINLCTRKLTGRVELRASAQNETCEGCTVGGDASHTYAQGICGKTVQG